MYEVMVYTGSAKSLANHLNQLRDEGTTFVALFSSEVSDEIVIGTAEAPRRYTFLVSRGYIEGGM